MPVEVFNRYELKYLIDSSCHEKFVNQIKGHTCIDMYGDEKGYYNIKSLYYDNSDYTFYSDTINDRGFRQKFRLRAYNNVSMDDYVFLEIKQKHRGVVNKRRTMLRLKDAYRFLENGDELFDWEKQGTNTQVLNEIRFLKDFYGLTPKVMLSYDRQAFYSLSEEDVRITFDKNLCKSETDLRVEANNKGSLFMDEHFVVMEIKANFRVPLWLSEILSELGIFRRSFSKYTTSYNGSEFTDSEKYLVHNI